MTTTALAPETWDHLAAAVELLDRAARATLDDTPEQKLDCAHYTFGHGIYLAWAQACAMLPANHITTAALPTGAETVTRLLVAAEEHTRALPLGVPELDGLSQLVRDLCDLIREARALGC